MSARCPKRTLETVGRLGWFLHMSVRKAAIVASFGAIFTATLFLADSSISEKLAIAFIYVAGLVIFIAWVFAIKFRDK